ncbi:MAG TPA: TMEM175 family protein, partial [Streptosporangiaceae bacterium]
HRGGYNRINATSWRLLTPSAAGRKLPLKRKLSVLRDGAGGWARGAGCGAESRATDRLTLFSDAVVAIAITLLAIELPVPEGGTVHLFWESVRHNGGHYAAFLISFFAIAAAWRDHHDIFKYVTRVDSRLRTLNTVWLLMIVLNPFATRLLTAPGHPDLDTHALRFGFYALLQVLESATVFVMLAHILSHGLAPRTPRAMAIDVARQSFNLILGFGLSIPVFFRHHQRLDLVDRRPAGGVTVASCPTPQAEPRGGRLSARVIQPPVATGRAGSVTQLDQEPT